MLTCIHGWSDLNDEPCDECMKFWHIYMKYWERGFGWRVPETDKFSHEAFAAIAGSLEGHSYSVDTVPRFVTYRAAEAAE